MEDLFSTNISVNNKSISYQVVFNNEQYVFVANDQSNNNEFSTFSFRRENDEWHEQQFLPDDLRKEALEALEKYLLSQH